jgi:hypothetical protein
MKYIVTRTFPSSPSVTVGETIDASGWRNRLLLERQGFIKNLEIGVDAGDPSSDSSVFVTTESNNPDETIQNGFSPEQELITGPDKPVGDATGNAVSIKIPKGFKAPKSKRQLESQVIGTKKTNTKK